MFTKSIIYLLFASVFTTVNVDSSLGENKGVSLSNQEIIENGVGKVKDAFASISLDGINNFIESNEIISEIGNGKTHSQEGKNQCSNKVAEDFCLY